MERTPEVMDSPTDGILTSTFMLLVWWFRFRTLV
jgi:hypothetical protein